MGREAEGAMRDRDLAWEGDIVPAITTEEIRFWRAYVAEASSGDMICYWVSSPPGLKLITRRMGTSWSP